MLSISNPVAKILTLLLFASAAWGGALALLGYWLFDISLLTAWHVALAVLGGMMLVIVFMAIEFYRSFDPNELMDDEGTEFLEAVMLGSESF